MKRIFYAASLALAVLFIPACGGGSSNSSSGSKQTQQGGGLAPESITADMILTPTNTRDVGGRILLKRQDGYDRVAQFSSRRDAGGDYVDGGFEPGGATYTGNYIYTKCGPNVAELRLENLRAEPGDTADDCIWTIYGYLTFKDEKTVSFSGTQTLISSHTADDTGNADEEGAHNQNHNDPMAFGGQSSNHLPGVQHNDGGSRNFQSLIYTYSMDN